MTARLRLTAVALAWAVAAPAMAAPLLLIDGGDRSVVVLDLGTRGRAGDVRRANIYRGFVQEPGAPRRVLGERYEFDCPGRRERLVATLQPQPGHAPLETPASAPWQAIEWRTPMDFASTAVCLNVYDDDKLSSKTDVTSMLVALEAVWNPAPIQPELRQAPPPKRKRSWLRPF